ncbi:hypothetical protein Naga_100053g37 [Nannochloropsis gaditana]|uniref:Uncharacterized protein n=1 Tax=Nannochloropsis gaditana TaxID=72520 RepID=W7TAC8_9STRA|nr:hypothetical protein Naga_100053g37 [Nannochloropsis gaditana]
MRLQQSTVVLCLLLGYILCYFGSPNTSGVMVSAAKALEEGEEKASARRSNTRGAEAKRMRGMKVDVMGGLESEDDDNEVWAEDEDVDEEEYDDDDEEADEEEEEGEIADDTDDELDDDEYDSIDDDEMLDDAGEEHVKNVQRKGKKKVKPVVLDDVASKDGELRGSLILDEISSYMVEDFEAPGGTITYYKVVLHLSNAGQRPLCGMTVAVPPKRGMEIEQLWTMEESEIEDVYDVLWTDYVPPKDPRHGVRYFGLVTKGAAPNVTIDSLSPCLSDYEDDDEEDADLDDDEMESEEEGGAEDAKHGPGRVAKRVVAGHPKPLARGRGVPDSLPRRGLQARQLPADAGLPMPVDPLAANWTLVEVLETLVLKKAGPGPEAFELLVNARVSNMGQKPLCDLSLFVRDLHLAGAYWSLLPVEGTPDVARLPSKESSLMPGQSHYFGLVVEETAKKEGEQEGQPNLVVLTAKECVGMGPAAGAGKA